MKSQRASATSRRAIGECSPSDQPARPRFRHRRAPDQPTSSASRNILAGHGDLGIVAGPDRQLGLQLSSLSKTTAKELTYLSATARLSARIRRRSIRPRAQSPEDAAIDVVDGAIDLDFPDDEQGRGIPPAPDDIGENGERIAHAVLTARRLHVGGRADREAPCSRAVDRRPATERKAARRHADPIRRRVPGVPRRRLRLWARS